MRSLTIRTRRMAYIRAAAQLPRGGQGRRPGPGQGRADLPGPGRGRERPSRPCMEDKACSAPPAAVWWWRSSSPGPRCRVLAFTDGKTVVPMVSCMDHKRALRRRQGPEHRRHGHRSPQPLLHQRQWPTRCMEKIFLPTVAAMQRRGLPLQGLPLLRPDAHPRRPQGHRVQLPLRRS